MSEDSSCDEGWCVSAKKLLDEAHREGECWECGKKFSKVKSLMSHYKSHNIEATCHICNITFRRLTSLSLHLDNAHLPAVCYTCNKRFSNAWELNKHAEKNCKDSPASPKAPSVISGPIICNEDSNNVSPDGTEPKSMNSPQCDTMSKLRPRKQTEKPEIKLKYVVGKDAKNINRGKNCENVDDSTSSDTDNEDKMQPKSRGSSSSHYSSRASHKPHSKSPTPANSAASSTCGACGKGPFRSVKLHLLHCSGIRVKYSCPVCKKIFPTEVSLKEHYMPLYSCEICGQVFPHENSYYHHQCPKGTKSPLVLFCSEAMPQACNICKLFFTSEKTLLNHVTLAHMSVVSTKVCIITNPSALTDGKLSPGFLGTAAQSATRSPNEVNQAINGKLPVGQTCAGPLPTVHSVFSSSHAAETSTAPVRLETAMNKPHNHHSTPSSVPPGTTDTTLTKNNVRRPVPTIMAMFENDSHDVALTKRMNTGWRNKTPHPCRQCGAILRQPSLIISHRYLHRGPRSHRCQCGRVFKHQLHLLRHCVQHAETMSYICVSCGDTFTGAKLLAEHLKGKSQKKYCSESTWKCSVERKCKTPFTCDCGKPFFRPSSYIWHQLKNKTRHKTKKIQKKHSG